MILILYIDQKQIIFKEIQIKNNFMRKIIGSNPKNK